MSNFVQANGATYSTSTSFTNSLSGVTAGNTLVVCFSFQKTADIGSVSGGAAHWTEAAFVNFETNNSLSIWIATNATGGSTTVTISTSPTTVFGAFTLSEYAVVQTLDQYGTSSGTATTFSTATLTTMFASETLIAFGAGDAGAVAASSPFNGRAGISLAGINYAETADLDEATAGMYSAAFTQAGASNYGTIIISLYNATAVMGVPGILAATGVGAS